MHMSFGVAACYRGPGEDSKQKQSPQCRRPGLFYSLGSQASTNMRLTMPVAVVRAVRHPSGEEDGVDVGQLVQAAPPYLDG